MAIHFCDEDIKVNDYLDYDGIKYTKLNYKWEQNKKAFLNLSLQNEILIPTLSKC